MEHSFTSGSRSQPWVMSHLSWQRSGSRVREAGWACPLALWARACIFHDAGAGQMVNERWNGHYLVNANTTGSHVGIYINGCLFFEPSCLHFRLWGMLVCWYAYARRLEVPSEVKGCVTTTEGWPRVIVNTQADFQIYDLHKYFCTRHALCLCVCLRMAEFYVRP